MWPAWRRCGPAFPIGFPAFTVNRLCGSGLQSIVDAQYRIAAGQAEAILAGGVESMSNIPLLYSHESQEVFTEVFSARDVRAASGRPRSSVRRHFKPEIGLLKGLTDPVCGLNMGETAEVLAKEHGITREEQDAFALRSHQRVDDGRAQARRGDRAGADPPELRAWPRRTTASARTRPSRRWRSSALFRPASSAR